MKELKTYIFIDITEIAMKHFATSKFLTFSNYCITYGLTIFDGKVPLNDKYLLSELYDYLKGVYSLNNQEVGDYLYEYFTQSVEELSKLQKVVVIMDKYYSDSYL